MCALRQNKLLAIIRCSVPMFGLLFICLAAFLISTSKVNGLEGGVIFAHCLVTLGFLMLLLGICWNTYHEAHHKSFLLRVLRQPVPDCRDFHLSTVDRPDVYPPSYEESIDAPNYPKFVSGCAAIGNGQRFDIPPPSYTEHSLESIREPHAEEELPPSYEESAQAPSILRDLRPPAVKAPQENADLSLTRLPLNL